MKKDIFKIGKYRLKSRLIVGTGKYNSFKETANAVKGMELLRAIDYLHQVVAHERCIPFRRYNHSMGRCS